MANNPNSESQQNKPKSSKLVVIAVGAVLFLGLGGGGFWYASHNGLLFSKQTRDRTPRTATKDAPPSAVLQLQSFVVNLADPDHSAFLRVGIALGLSKPLPAGSDAEKNSPYTPQVRDAVISILATWKSQDLLALDGKKKLKEQLLKTLQKRIPQLGVTNIYFTDFLIQQ